MGAGGERKSVKAFMRECALAQETSRASVGIPVAVHVETAAFNGEQTSRARTTYDLGEERTGDALLQDAARMLQDARRSPERRLQSMPQARDRPQVREKSVEREPLQKYANEREPLQKYAN